MVNIHYKGNSDLLQAFYGAVESGVLLWLIIDFRLSVFII
jgi:hypothetical protein